VTLIKNNEKQSHFSLQQSICRSHHRDEWRCRAQSIDGSAAGMNGAALPGEGGQSQECPAKAGNVRNDRPSLGIPHIALKIGHSRHCPGIPDIARFSTLPVTYI
jgi:hypothetical protein